MGALWEALADALLMGLGFFFGMLFMRERYLRLLEEKAPGGSFEERGKCG